MGKRKIELEFVFCNIIQKEISIEEEQELFDHINGHEIVLTTGKKRCSNMMACNTRAIRCMYSMTNSDINPFLLKRVLPTRQKSKGGPAGGLVRWFNYRGALADNK